MEAPSADPYHPPSLPSCNHLIFTFRSVAISDTRYGSRRINLGMAAQAYLASNPYPPSGRQAGSFYVTFWKSKGGGWEKQRTLSSLAASHESRRPQKTEMLRAQRGGAYNNNRFVSPSVITHDSAPLKQSKAAARHSNPLSRPRSFEDGSGLLVSPTV